MANLKKTRTKKQMQDDFLESLEQTGNISLSCKLTKIGRRTVYGWITNEPGYKERHEASVLIGIDLLEDEAQRRAFHGVKKPVYQGGKKVGVVQEYSDTLLIFLLKGKKPDVYKDRHEHTGKDGKDLNIVTIFELPSNGRDKED